MDFVLFILAVPIASLALLYGLLRAVGGFSAKQIFIFIFYKDEEIIKFMKEK